VGDEQQGWDALMFATLQAKMIAAGLLLVLIAGAAVGVQLWSSARYNAGVQAGRDAVLADDGRAAAQLYQQHAQLDEFSAVATAALSQTLSTQLPAIQAAANATAVTIRTIYRDRPVPADLCSRPDGVQQALDAAVQRANAAARGQLRPDPTASGNPAGAGTARRP
jgi:hypothetical protein